jgi:2'-5' RNA ligase
MPQSDDPLGPKGIAQNPTTLRVFFALWPDAAAADLMAAAARDIVRRAGGRAPRAENHHLTLAFVGEVAVDRIDALKRIGASAALVVAPFVLTLDRLGAFHHTGIAWIGTDNPPPGLSRLVSALRDGLAANALPFERRRYRAHVTIARRSGRLATAAIAPVAWRVERVTLIASELLPAGSRYRELAAWPLKRSASEVPGEPDRL